MTNSSLESINLMAHMNTWFPSCPLNMQLGCLFFVMGGVLFINPAIFPTYFGLPSIYIVVA